MSIIDEVQMGPRKVRGFSKNWSQVTAVSYRILVHICNDKQIVNQNLSLMDLQKNRERCLLYLKKYAEKDLKSITSQT